MIDLATCLRHYKKEFVQKAIVELAKDREVAVKYGDNGFGKRPDVLNYPADVFEFVKKGVTSFHISEERWKDPLSLRSGMPKKEIEELRNGWDLIIDIDSKAWTISRMATWIIVSVLKEMNLKNISVKFSGNKGFHIGVPFESFPEEIGNNPTYKLFPELPKRISSFIVQTIQDKGYVKVKNEKIIFGGKYVVEVAKLKEALEEKKVELIKYYCPRCGKETEKEAKTTTEFICRTCGNRIVSDSEFVKCERCNKLMQKITYKEGDCSCGSKEQPIPRFNILSVIEIDTLLISSRHMYRSVYSLHEKSGLVSIPVEIEGIMTFKKNDAHPDRIKETNLKFLDPEKSTKNEAHEIIHKMLEHESSKDLIRKDDIVVEKKYTDHEFSKFEEAAPIEFFPPCIKMILNGLEDGKKRALFIITNFLYNVGWDSESIEILLKEWNKKCPEQLSETVLLGHLRYHKHKKEKVLPPNCDNRAYYKDMGICKPDNLCQRIKNPVNYTRRRVFGKKRNEKRNKKGNQNNKR